MTTLAEGIAFGNRHQRWDRMTCTEKMTEYDRLASDGWSQRRIAKKIGVPLTTLQAWQRHRRTLDAEPDLITFFESSIGLAFLHRLVSALQVVFVEQGAAGVALVAKLLKLAGLDRFVASSPKAQRKLNLEIEEAIVEFSSKERSRIAKVMPGKDITVCQDETYTGGLCLVAMEPESGFAVLERTADDRTASTWAEYMNDAMKDLEKVTIIQSTSDEAKGILSYVDRELGRAGAEAQWRLICAAHNLSKILNC